MKIHLPSHLSIHQTFPGFFSNLSIHQGYYRGTRLLTLRFFFLEHCCSHIAAASRRRTWLKLQQFSLRRHDCPTSQGGAVPETSCDGSFWSERENESFLRWTAISLKLHWDFQYESLRFLRNLNNTIDLASSSIFYWKSAARSNVASAK